MHFVTFSLQIYVQTVVRLHEHLLIQSTRKTAERRQKSIIPRVIDSGKPYCSSSAKVDIFEKSAYR